MKDLKKIKEVIIMYNNIIRSASIYKVKEKAMEGRQSLSLSLQ